MMENKTNKKKKFILSLIGIIVLVLFSVGLTYAFYSYTSIGTRNNVINTLSISINFEDNNWIWLENAFPMTTEEALTLETNGNGINDTVKGGIAQFKVFGNDKNGTINYELFLEKGFSSSTMYSKDNTYSLNPDNYIALFPDETISINLQTSTSNIFETTGLVNDRANLYYSRNSFRPSVNSGYLNESGSITIRDLANDGIYIDDDSTPTKILGYGSISGEYSIRYFELRMWVNENATVATDTLRDACIANTSQQDVNKYGYGYCDPNTPNLPEGVKYLYTAGEYSKLFFSNKIRIETTEVMRNVEPDIIKKMKKDNQIKNETANMYNNAVTTAAQSGLFLQESTRDNVYPIYFYRGIVNNNHLLFADKCWRIVRTTETGGTKIIYDGVPNNGTCNNTGTATQVKTAAFNFSYNSPAYVGYKYGNTHPSSSSKSASELSSMGNIVYGKDIKYRNGRYTLTDIIAKNGANYSTDYNDTSTSGIRYHHYTCLNGSTSCNTVYYVYYLSSSTMYYMTLTGGKTHTQLLNEMLSENNGTEKSNAYNELNAWYTANLLSSYADYLEDTVFCNDRSIADYGGWDINNSNAGMNFLYFGAYGRLYTNKTPSLTCINPGDRYTVSESNGNGELEYPIGLLTADEYVFAGAKYETANSLFYLYNGQSQWSFSPYSFNDRIAHEFSLDSHLYYYPVSYTYGLRPVVSLAPGATITSGNGSSNSPYLIELN